MRKKIFIFLLSTVAAVCPAVAQNKSKSTVLDVKTSITDNNIVYPESFELDTHKMLEGWYMKNYAATDDRYKREGDRNTDDKTIRDRLAKLPTVIDMPFNSIVRSYIDKYMKSGREQVTVLLGLGNYYLPIFEQALEEKGLPLELKYLPVIESGLDPNAISKHGATGLWQFMLATAHGLGMEVNSLVDERRDPYLSSKKAAQYIKDLYKTYGDWSLAIAAYNCGPTVVNKAIRRAGGDPKNQDFWSFYNYLPAETRGYVPMFIAANYVMNYYKDHNINPVLQTKPLVTDTLMISDRVHFDQISNVLNIPLDELRVLNPQFRADLIPGSVEHAYTLVLPSQQIHAYLMSENDIKQYEAEKYARRLSAEPGEVSKSKALAMNSAPSVSDDGNTPAVPVATASSTKGARTITHKVKPGESLAQIASQYGVYPEDIKRWNNLRRNAVRTGQMLRITTASASDEATDLVADATPVQEAAPTTATASATRSSKATKTQTQKGKTGNSGTAAASSATTHKLKTGDTLSSLAKRYGVSVAEIKKANNMKNDNLRAGQSIKIPAKTKAASSTAKSTTAKKSKKRRR